MNNKKIKILLLVMMMCFTGTACSNEQSDQEVKENSSSKKLEDNYLECAFNEELYDIMFEKDPYEYRISYDADYYLTTIEGHQDMIYIESFFIYEEDLDGNIINCKSVMITKPELNQKYMEEYLAFVYGETYEYTKPFDNVYVHFEIIP